MPFKYSKVAAAIATGVSFGLASVSHLLSNTKFKDYSLVIKTIVKYKEYYRTYNEYKKVTLNKYRWRKINGRYYKDWYTETVYRKQTITKRMHTLTSIKISYYTAKV